MTASEHEHDEPRPESPEEGGDYSYDLVHDEVPTPGRPGPAAERARGPEAAAEQRPDQATDYSYDLAHDVPPSRPRR